MNARIADGRPYELRDQLAERYGQSPDAVHRCIAALTHTLAGQIGFHGVFTAEGPFDRSQPDDIANYWFELSDKAEARIREHFASCYTPSPPQNHGPAKIHLQEVYEARAAAINIRRLMDRADPGTESSELRRRLNQAQAEVTRIEADYDAQALGNAQAQPSPLAAETGPNCAPEPTNIETHTGTVHARGRKSTAAAGGYLPACCASDFAVARYHYLAPTDKPVTCKRCMRKTGS